MERRELFKAVPALALGAVNWKEKLVGAAVELKPNRHYLMFVDSAAVDLESLAQSYCPPGTEIQFFAVHLRDGQSLDEHVRIFEIEQGGEHGNKD